MVDLYPDGCQTVRRTMPPYAGRIVIAAGYGLRACPAMSSIMSITLEWLGHCSFRLVSNGGPSVLIDPFDETIGLRLPPYDCDILLISHSHYDTAAKHLVPPEYEAVRSKGTSLVKGLAINALPWWHDQRQGKDYGSVLMFHFELDGFRVVYLSHIGCVPRQWAIDELKGADICFIPVGGVFALGPKDAAELARELAPKLILPMHFNLRHLSFTLGPLSDFTKLMSDSLVVKDWRVEIEPEDLPSSPNVLLMRHWPGVAP